MGAGPGFETAAPTTAALATGDGPGLTAAPTTAARPRREERSGISGSCANEGFLVGLDCGDDGLDRDPALGDQLASGVAHGRGEARGPQVLVDEHGADAARL